MRTLNLLVCSAALLALVFVPTAQASDEAIAPEGAVSPAGPIEATSEMPAAEEAAVETAGIRELD